MQEREEAIETREGRMVEVCAEIRRHGQEMAQQMPALAEGLRRVVSAEESSKSAPRPWEALYTAWMELRFALYAVVGGVAFEEIVALPNRVGASARVVDLHLRVWRWMWMLPPGSEARKAAFTLGHAAMMIDRWRSAPTCEHIPSHVPDPEPIGQRAEALLRILRWHIDDARGEASAKRDEPSTLPTWERLYERGQDGRFLVGYAWMPLAGVTGWSGAEDMEETARAILDDHIEHRREDRARLARIISRTGRTDLIDAFAKTAILSLPEGPWTMTSADVVRFADMLLDDAEPAKAVSP